MMLEEMDDTLRYIAYGHLLQPGREVSRPFSALAHEVAERSPASREAAVAVRKLLEAKDAAVRAALSAGG